MHEATLRTAADAEQLTLGTLVLYPELIGDAAKKLLPRDYADPLNREFFDTLTAMHRGNVPIDPVALRHQLDRLPLFANGGSAAFIAETMTKAGLASSLGHHLNVIAELSRKRRLGQLGRHIVDAAANGHASSEIIADGWAALDDFRREADPNARELESYSLPEFLRLDHRQKFLIQDVVTEAQPGVVSAKSKTNKTTIALAMQVAIASGRPFLNHYEVPETQPCGIISAESGGATLAESFSRVSAAMGLLPSELKNLHVSTRMPSLTTPEGLDQLERHILKYGLKSLACDPTYKAFAGVDDSQLSQMALHLFPLSEIIDRTGCSIQMVHHNRKTPARQGDHYAEPTQDDIQGTGFSQWARFFVLLNKRREWDPNEGKHWLWLKTEGSAGFGSRFFLNLTEGRRCDPGGRIWDVALSAPTEALEQEKGDATALKESRQMEADRKAVCAVLAKHPDGLSWSKALRDSKVSSRRYDFIKETMLDEGDVEECEVTISNQKKPRPGVKLSTSEAT